MAFPMRLPARWLASTMGRLTLLSGVGYVAGAYAVSRFLTRPRRRKLTMTPGDIGLSCQNVSVRTEDQIPLAGWLVDVPEPRGTVALFHGMRQSRETMLGRIEFLAAAGYRCLAIDHRAHGESGGKRISFGWYEARDVRAVAQWLDERFPQQPRYALGISMGAAALCFAGAACGWRGLVLEGVYADLAAAFRRRIGHYYPAWFGKLYPGIIWITEKRLRVRISAIRPATSIGALAGIPKLLLTGERDLLAPPDDMAGLVRNAPDAQAEIILDAGHSDVLSKGAEVYKSLVTNFLQSNN